MAKDKKKFEKHILTEEDMAENPKYAEDGLAVGDEIEREIQAGADTSGDLMALLRGINDSIGTLAHRVEGLDKDMKNIKSGGKDAFKQEAKKEDIETASELRKGVDPKICDIVDEILGTDFGIELYGLGDRPGFFLNLVVPQRLNDNAIDRRPVRDPATGEYVFNADKSVKMEEYKIPDKRGKVLSTADSYDAVRQHCERVRAYMVAYYQRANRPMPALNVA